MEVINSKAFSKLQDEDYKEKQEGKKRAVRRAHIRGAIGGGSLGLAAGGYIGGSIGSVTGDPLKGALIGAGIGTAAAAGLGYLGGKKHKKEVEEEADRKLSRYAKADERDKKYLREKEEREDDRAVQERQARAMEDQAWQQRRVAWHTFSEKASDEKKGKGAKIAAGVVGGTAAAAGVGYAGLKVAKKGLENKLAKQGAEHSKAVAEYRDHIEKNLDGMGNKVKNFFNPGRKKAALEAKEQLGEKARQAASDLAKTQGKIEKVDRVLKAPKAVIDKVKATVEEHQPAIQNAKRKARGAVIVAERKTRKFLRNAAKDVKGLLKK